MDNPKHLDFDFFWTWLQGHPNCILRMGTPQMILNDDESFHWMFGEEDAGNPVLQVHQGKRIVAEMLIIPEVLTHVEVIEEEESVLFELNAETEGGTAPIYFIVTSHGVEDEEGSEASVH